MAKTTSSDEVLNNEDLLNDKIMELYQDDKESTCANVDLVGKVCRFKKYLKVRWKSLLQTVQRVVKLLPYTKQVLDTHKGASTYANIEANSTDFDKVRMEKHARRLIGGIDT